MFMNDTIKTINHKIQEMSFEDLRLICTKHSIDISDGNLNAILSLIKNNPSTIMFADYHRIIYIQILNKLDDNILNIFKPLIEKDYLMHDIKKLCKIN